MRTASPVSVTRREEFLRRLVVSAPEAAALLGRSPQTLKGWRMTGVGPPFGRATGAVDDPVPTGHVFYRVKDIEAWVDERVTVEEGRREVLLNR